MVVGGALAFRHRWPVPVLYATLAGLLVYLIQGYPGGPIYLGVFIAIASLASLVSSRQALAHVIPRPHSCIGMSGPTGCSRRAS